MSSKSPIIAAIQAAEQNTTGEIRVHLSKRFFEKDPYARALKLFHQFGMSRTPHRNAVLFYVNLRRKKFAIVGDEGIHQKVGQRCWEEIARSLGKDLKETHPERAIAQSVLRIGTVLSKHFPLKAES
jgi:uncharacterized membrane protein